MKLKIAVAQIKIDILNSENMFNKIESFLKKASGKANIIVFPEYTISWNFINQNNNFTKRFCELAKKYRIDIVTGSMLDKQNNKTYNTALYIDSSGRIRGTYRKINLWHTEASNIAFGNEICVFNTKYGKIGLVICWDLVFPELYRAMVKEGVKIVICPAFWDNKDISNVGIKYNYNAEKTFIDGCCISRACENEIIHVFCNAAGSVKNGRKKYTLVGHSQITAPFKGILNKINSNKEAIFIQKVNTKILSDAEKGYNIRKSLKRAYH